MQTENEARLKLRFWPTPSSTWCSIDWQPPAGGERDVIERTDANSGAGVDRLKHYLEIARTCGAPLDVEGQPPRQLYDKLTKENHRYLHDAVLECGATALPEQPEGDTKGGDPSQQDSTNEAGEVSPDAGDPTNSKPPPSPPDDTPDATGDLSSGGGGPALPIAEWEPEEPTGNDPVRVEAEPYDPHQDPVHRELMALGDRLREDEPELADGMGLTRWIRGAITDPRVEGTLRERYDLYLEIKQHALENPTDEAMEILEAAQAAVAEKMGGYYYRADDLEGAADRLEEKMKPFTDKVSEWREEAKKLREKPKEIVLAEGWGPKGDRLVLSPHHKIGVVPATDLKLRKGDLDWEWIPTDWFDDPELFEERELTQADIYRPKLKALQKRAEEYRDEHGCWPDWLPNGMRPGRREHVQVWT